MMKNRAVYIVMSSYGIFPSRYIFRSPSTIPENWLLTTLLRVYLYCQGRNTDQIYTTLLSSALKTEIIISKFRAYRHRFRNSPHNICVALVGILWYQVAGSPINLICPLLKMIPLKKNYFY